MASNYVQVKNRFNQLPNTVQKYFSSFTNLLPSPQHKERTWEILIAYLFMKVEQAQHNTIYGAMTKKYNIDGGLAWIAIDEKNMTRTDFVDLYKNLAKTPIKTKTIKRGRYIQSIRNKVIHGKVNKAADDKKKKGNEKGNEKGLTLHRKKLVVISILEYADSLNNQVFEELKFRPFGTIKDTKKPHDKETSRWMLIGMGFNDPTEIKKTKKQEAQENARQNNNQEPVAQAEQQEPINAQ